MKHQKLGTFRAKSGMTVGLGLLLASLFGFANAADISSVPKTGQTATLPFTPITGGDGQSQKGAAWPSPRFVLDASGNCITDQLTGLMWLKNVGAINTPSTINWDAALTKAANGTWCGYDDWRVPNINELASLINYGYSRQDNWLMYGSGDATTPACDGACFINLPSSSTVYWSSSIYAYTTTARWGLNMAPSSTSSFITSLTSSNSAWLLPVRGGK